MITKSRSQRSAVCAILIASALAFSACSATAPTTDPTASAPNESSAPSLVPAAEGKSTYPMTLETPWGKTELHKRPERIAAVTPSQDDAEVLAAMGVTPIIASEFATDKWITDALPQPIPERFTRGDSKFPVEQIAKAKPDLIIVLNTDITDDYAKLSSVAPVLATTVQNGSESSVANDWESSILRIGEVLDLQDVAKKVLSDEKDFFASFRSKHPEFSGLTASYLVYYGDEGGLQFHSTEGSPSEFVFEQMGFAPNPNAKKFTYRQEISEELLSTVDADVILFSDNSDGNYAKITEQPLFKKLKAVQDDHLVLIDNRATEGTFVVNGTSYEGNFPWALARSGPLSATWAAEKIVPALTETLKR